MSPKKPKKKPGVLPFAQKPAFHTPNKTSIIDISASSRERLSQLAEPDLRVAIMRIVHYGTVWQTWHAGQEREYRNVSNDDIQHMLLGAWVLERAPEWSEEHHNWKYRLRGADLEGDELTLIVAVNTEEQKIAVVTKF